MRRQCPVANQPQKTYNAAYGRIGSNEFDRNIIHRKAGIMARVISFINYKGGVGKTTTTFHIGCALARPGGEPGRSSADQRGKPAEHGAHEAAAHAAAALSAADTGRTAAVPAAKMTPKDQQETERVGP